MQQFRGLPRRLDIRDHAGKLYVDELRARQQVCLVVMLDGVEQQNVLAYDQDQGVVEVEVIGPLGARANPEVRKGRVTVTLRAVEPPKPVDNPYGWFGLPFP